MRMQKAEGGRRKGITTTVIVPRWQKNLKAGLRGLKRNLLYLLAAIGGMWVTWQVMLWLSVHVAGGG